MSKDKRVLMEKFQGFEIYFEKDTERFTADKKKLNIHFEAQSLFSIKNMIRNSKTEEINQEAIIKTGYFNKQLSKILILTRNTAHKTYGYKILDCTENSYDVGQIKHDDIDAHDDKIYPLSEHNLKIYDEIKKLEEDIDEIENKQRRLVKELKAETNSKAL